MVEPASILNSIYLECKLKLFYVFFRRADTKTPKKKLRSSVNNLIAKRLQLSVF